MKWFKRILYPIVLLAGLLVVLHLFSILSPWFVFAIFALDGDSMTPWANNGGLVMALRWPIHEHDVVAFRDTQEGWTVKRITRWEDKLHLEGDNKQETKRYVLDSPSRVAGKIVARLPFRIPHSSSVEVAGSTVISPDGRSKVFVKNGWIYLAAPGHKPQKISRGHHPSWLPDGSGWQFQHDGAYHAYLLDSEQVILLGDFVWASDAATYSISAGKIYRLAKGALVPVSAGGWLEEGPDGSVTVYQFFPERVITTRFDRQGDIRGSVVTSRGYKLLPDEFDLRFCLLTRRVEKQPGTSVDKLFDGDLTTTITAQFAAFKFEGTPVAEIWVYGPGTTEVELYETEDGIEKDRLYAQHVKVEGDKTVIRFIPPINTKTYLEVRFMGGVSEVRMFGGEETHPLFF